MSHANAALTPRARLRLARLIVEQGWPIARAAERFDVSWPTAKRWAERYRRLGPSRDGSTAPSRPHRSPAPDPGAGGPQDRAPAVEAAAGPGRRSPRARDAAPRPCTRCWSGAGSTGWPTSTGPPASRSAATSTTTPGRCSTWTSRSSATSPTAAAGATSGGQQGEQNRAATRRHRPRNSHHNPRSGTAFVHTVIDDHSRVAYAEIHDDETAATATARAAPRGGLVRRPRRHRRTGPVRQRLRLPLAPVARHLRRARHHARQTRPYRPQTNGKIERFHRTLADGWAFARFYTTETARRTPCQHGSTSTTTTGPTPPAGTSHPSPA